MSDPNLKSTEIKHILKEVKCISGIDFSQYAFSFIKRRVEQFMIQHEIVSDVDLIYRINKSPLIVGQFLEFVFVSPSELFRDAELWNYIEAKLLPKLLSKKEVKIHFPYTTGNEELYSLLYILNNFPTEHIHIVITSVTDKHASIVKKGIFNATQIKASQKNIELLDSAIDSDDIYSKNAQTFQVKTNFKGILSYEVCDFFKAKYISEFDVIFFRNSLLYFNTELKEKALSTTIRSLKKNGLLLIGEKETIGKESGRKLKQNTKNLSVYKKKSFS